MSLHGPLSMWESAHLSRRCVRLDVPGALLCQHLEPPVTQSQRISPGKMPLRHSMPKLSCYKAGEQNPTQTAWGRYSFSYELVILCIIKVINEKIKGGSVNTKHKTFYLEIMSRLQKIAKIKISQRTLVCCLLRLAYYKPRTPFTLAFAYTLFLPTPPPNLHTFFSEGFEDKLHRSWPFIHKCFSVYS